MQRTAVINRIVPTPQAAPEFNGTEPALNVATVYQDPLTRHWAVELWDRVGQLISSEGLSCRSWKISALTDPGIFDQAVQAAAAADVLVVSVRDAGEWPTSLNSWIDAWQPKRGGRAGALVALIGVPCWPDAKCGSAHRYLETVARESGLDFLPRERKLPEAPVACIEPARSGNGSPVLMKCYARPASPGASRRPRWRVIE